MATDDPAADEPAPPGPEPQPELADWWVWGVRKVAGVVAEFLMISRGLALLFIFFKLALWALSRDNSELYQAAAGIAALLAAWATARLLGRFAWAHESPDPERWLAQWRRR